MTPKVFAPIILIIGCTLAGCASSPSSRPGPASPSSSAGAAEVVDLSGDWTINEASSDDPADELQSMTTASREARRSSPISVGASVFGIPVGDITDLFPERERSGGGRRDPPRHVTDAIDALDIVQSTDTVRVDYDGLGTFIYRNGETMSDDDTSVHAEWRQGRYVVERQIPGGPVIVEEFRLDPNDASRLYWLVTIKVQSGKNVSITRVYDRAASDSPVNNS